LKKHLMRIALGLVVVLAFAGHAARYYKIPSSTNFENIVYDARLRLTMANSTIANVIIDIDEKSLAARAVGHGRRENLAPCLTSFSITTRPESSGSTSYSRTRRKFRTGHPAELGQKELKGNAQYQAVLKDVAPQLEYDRVFAEKLKARAIVLGYYFSDVRSEDGKGRSFRCASQARVASRHFKAGTSSLQAGRAMAPIWKSFSERPLSGGHFQSMA